MRKAVSVIGALLISVPAIADPIPKSPTDRWVVDFDDAQCVAMRNYGTKDSPFVLALKQPALGEVMQLSVVRRGIGPRFAEQHDASISLDEGKSIALTVVSAAVKQTGNIIVRTNIPRSTFDLVARSRTMRIRAKDQLDEAFQLSQVDGVLKVLDQCAADLQHAWNVTDPEVATLKKRASGSIAGLISPDDYPGVALDEDQGGTVSYALLIDEKGKVADCTVIDTSGVAALDAQSCAIIKAKAQFVPAVGSDGKPAKDATTGKITWKIL
jgi:TonB family protein